MISALQITVRIQRGRTARSAGAIAFVARVAGADIDLEGWVTTEVKKYRDAERQALLLAAAAKELAEAGRVGGAIQLASEAIMTGRAAGKEVMLEVVKDAAPVLAAGGMSEEMEAIAEAVHELRSWF